MWWCDKCAASELPHIYCEYWQTNETWRSNKMYLVREINAESGETPSETELEALETWDYFRMSWGCLGFFILRMPPSRKPLSQFFSYLAIYCPLNKLKGMCKLMQACFYLNPPRQIFHDPVGSLYVLRDRETQIPGRISMNSGGTSKRLC